MTGITCTKKKDVYYRAMRQSSHKISNFRMRRWMMRTERNGSKFLSRLGGAI
jgi:hypothetical protein